MQKKNKCHSLPGQASQPASHAFPALFLTQSVYEHSRPSELLPARHRGRDIRRLLRRQLRLLLLLLNLRLRRLCFRYDRFLGGGGGGVRDRRQSRRRRHRRGRRERGARAGCCIDETELSAVLLLLRPACPMTTGLVGYGGAFRECSSDLQTVVLRLLIVHVYHTV